MLYFTLISAPALINVLTISKCPSQHATDYGLFVLSFRFATLPINFLTICKCPIEQAAARGVYLLAFILTSAPVSINFCAIAQCPFYIYLVYILYQILMVFFPSLILTSAPALVSFWAISMCPFWLADINGE